MAGFFGNMFDFNRDGKLDGFERAADFCAFNELMKEHNSTDYLDDDDDYSYQATSNNEEKYDARSSEELADLQ